jgi:hypothetical protein
MNRQQRRAEAKKKIIKEKEKIQFRKQELAKSKNPEKDLKRLEKETRPVDSRKVTLAFGAIVIAFFLILGFIIWPFVS